MREILFRAKAVNRERNSERRTDYENGDWVYGFISKEYDERFPNLPAEMTDKAGVTGIEVDYQSIGEYTGLNDKYGVRIFEGDILIYVVDGEYDVDEKYLVVFDDDEAAFKTKYYCEGKYMSYEDIIPCENFEVIGNIHDNKNLLKNQEVGE